MSVNLLPFQVKPLQVGDEQGIWHQAFLCSAGLAVLGEPPLPSLWGKPSITTSWPYPLWFTALPSKDVDPSEAKTHVHHHATGHSRFPQAFGDSLSPRNTAALKSSTGSTVVVWVSRSITVVSLHSFHQARFRRIFLRLVDVLVWVITKDLNCRRSSRLVCVLSWAICPVLVSLLNLLQTIFFPHWSYLVYHLFPWNNPSG